MLLTFSGNVSNNGNVDNSGNAGFCCFAVCICYLFLRIICNVHLHVIFQDMVNSYQCVCEVGWTGTDCDITISISECGTNCQAQTGEQAGGEIVPMIINFGYITGTFKLVVLSYTHCS